MRTATEFDLLSAQYEAEKKLGRVIDAGDRPPGGRWFPRFFVSPTYTIPKKKVIGQPQKWRLIHDLSSHSLGHSWSINAGIKKGDFPVTYPSIATATHEVFCKSRFGSVLWGRDLKAYYRHLMINPAYWWCTGTVLEHTYYFDCYCPFGTRSMPAVFQRLSDAIRVIMLNNIPVDGLLGMLDDYLGITYRNEGETDEELFRRGRLAAQAFDEELNHMGITKQQKKDSPTAWTTVWLGFLLDTRDHTLAIPSQKEMAVVFQIQEGFFDEDGGLLPVVNTIALGKLVGVLCHMSQAWALGKTLLWPLYQLLEKYKTYTPEGKVRYRKAQVELGYDGAAALMEWYERINTCGIYKKFYTCNGDHKTTRLSLWSTRTLQEKASGDGSTRGARKLKGKKLLELVTPWGSQVKTTKHLKSLMGREQSRQRVGMAIVLLLEFLREHANQCGDMITIKTNVGAFARYIQKDCYPSGLQRQSYVHSVEIHRLLSKPAKGVDEESRESRMIHPRQLKAWFIL